MPNTHVGYASLIIKEPQCKRELAIPGETSLSLEVYFNIKSGNLYV